MLEHYVLFAPQEGKAEELESALIRFSEGISTGCGSLVDISWGPNFNPSGLGRGFSYGCLARLSGDTLDEYWNHPAHQQLLSELDALCRERFAMDYLRADSAGTHATPIETTRSSS
ncbi:Dabb family protein [Arthrobacter sp. MA-N2]|uniref:Dabb family protein n=1 Tax=Arthrobacter sp. MA-N2 TaxID=1101188 RepID=UPI0004830A1B|nr:Dabb family protein [Arthrobacter sp. MA-N2]